MKELGTEAGKEAGEMVHGAITDPLGKHEEDHHGPPVNPNPLEWRADTAIWTGVVFLVVFVLLYFFAWGPIAQGLEKREMGIADNIASAEKSNEEAKALLAEYQSRLDVAEEEVKAMLNKARIDAQKTGEKIVEAAQTAAEEEHQRALAEIEQATISALSELATKSADLAVDLAGKIVRSELKASDHATLVSEAVSNFGKPK
jgi:F-type H+-transporting ATPase subunit b